MVNKWEIGIAEETKKKDKLDVLYSTDRVSLSFF